MQRWPSRGRQEPDDSPGDKASKQGIHPGFETQGRLQKIRSPKQSTMLPGCGPTKRLLSSQIIKKKYFSGTEKIIFTDVPRKAVHR